MFSITRVCEQSRNLKQEGKRQKHMNESDFSVLPEDCIAHVLSSTSPRDACKFATVSRTFKSAADSDNVWEKFLPPNYKDIVSKYGPSLNLSKVSSKKELYFRLCTPILLDDGNKSFNLEKNSGKVCLMLGPKQVSVDWPEMIQWNDANGHGLMKGQFNYSKCWQWVSLSHSRLADAIQLKGISCLMISSKINTRMLSPNTTYEAYLVLKVWDEAFTNDLIFANALLKVGFLQGEGCASGSRIKWVHVHVKPRPYGWKEIKMGQFYVDEEWKVGEEVVKMRLRGLRKRGIIIQGIEIRPRTSTKKTKRIET